MNLDNKTILRLKKNYGNWALITGATSGIGRELAMQLGIAGFHLVITGRREQLLNELAEMLFDMYRTEVIPVPGDLSKLEDVNQLLEEVKHLQPGIVILNAGFGTSGTFIKSDLTRDLNMIDLNIKTVTTLSHHFIQRMRKAQKRGALVLLSSIVAFQGVPNAATYAATKAYVQSFGEGIARELKPEGIDVLLAVPGPVDSGFADTANMKMDLTLTPEDVAVPILRAIGRRTVVHPGFLTKFLIYNLRMAPRWGRVRIMGMIMAGFTKHHAAG